MFLQPCFQEHFAQLHGKELSYNTILDLTAAASLIAEFAGDAPTLAILKHTNPCGVGQGDNLREAWERAFATDRQAPFGGIIAVNRPLDAETAHAPDTESQTDPSGLGVPSASAQTSADGVKVQTVPTLVRSQQVGGGAPAQFGSPVLSPVQTSL